MSKRRLQCALFFMACLLVAFLALAGPKDFWETKPYTEWTEKEVEKILLNDSPWSVRLLLNASGGGGSSKGGGGGEGPPPIYISWYARPIREAIVRRTVLQTPDTPKAQLDSILNYKSDFIEFMVLGYTPGGAARGVRGGGRGDTGAANEAMEKFKKETYLQKKDNTKIPLDSIRPPQGRNSPTFLRFPREFDGKPVVALEDKEIRLVIKINDNTFKFPFKLEKMVVKGALEM